MAVPCGFSLGTPSRRLANESPLVGPKIKPQETTCLGVFFWRSPFWLVLKRETKENQYVWLFSFGRGSKTNPFRFQAERCWGADSLCLPGHRLERKGIKLKDHAQGFCRPDVLASLALGLNLNLLALLGILFELLGPFWHAFGKLLAFCWQGLLLAFSWALKALGFVPGLPGQKWGAAQCPVGGIRELISLCTTRIGFHPSLHVLRLESVGKPALRKTTNRRRTNQLTSQSVRRALRNMETNSTFFVGGGPWYW